MFVLKSLFGQMWGNPSNPELIQLTSGQLYLVRPDSIKGSRECIYNHAVATVRRTGMEYQYQLVITRSYDAGEEQLLDGEDETDEERSFLLDTALSFRSGTLDGDITFAWRDLSGDPGDTWEYVVDGGKVTKTTSGVFEVTVLQCMYERKYQRSHDDATEKDLDDLKWKPRPKTSLYPTQPEELDMSKLTLEQPKAGPSSRAAGKKAITASSPDPESDPEPEPEPAADAGAEQPADEEPVEDLFAGVPVLHHETGQLFLYDLDQEIFVLQREKVMVDICEGGPFDYWLVVKDESPFISLPLDSEMVPRLEPTSFAFMFTYKSVEGSNSTWCIKFPDEEVFVKFKDSFAQYMWEGRNKMSWGKAKADEQQYIGRQYDDVEMTDVSDQPEEDEDEEDEEDEAEDTLGALPSDSEDESEQFAARAGKGKNQQLQIGYKSDRSFVVRGDMIGVFKHTDDDQLRFSTSINKIADTKGQSFTPKKLMLHNQDTDMLLMDANNKGSVYRMDLEYGKIVDEWKVSDSIAVENILPEAKYAQMNPTQTLVGHSHNGLFRIDPRVQGNKLVESQYKQYASKNDFSAATTTSSGKLAVASNKGDIRLFDAIGKNAKTALPALGDPIIGVDVTGDGRWLIATCKTYLLLIDTLINDGRYKGSLGFDRSFPADAKPIPRKLQLKPEHFAYMQTAVSFTPARFNAGVDQEEKSIVTSTGPYVITWNFKSVKRGKLDDYQIRKYQSDVVADGFKFGTDKNMVVALEQDVFMINKKQMQKPTRESLSTPVKQLRTRNSIVNSPY